MSDLAPRHIAIIMDGNGRWAAAKGLPHSTGHYKGADAVRAVVESACDMGVSYLTLYAFSEENWKRSKAEVTDLMGLLQLYLRKEINNLMKNDIALRVIGDRSKLGDKINQLIDEAEQKTINNSALTLVLALSYGGRQEIAQACKQIAIKVQSGQLQSDQIDEACFAKNLFTNDIPDPDLIIRTSGEKRLSNFLLWQSAYAELIFTDVLWPDFSKQDLELAIAEYHKRERRFGQRPALVCSEIDNQD